MAAVALAGVLTAGAVPVDAVAQQGGDGGRPELGEAVQRDEEVRAARRRLEQARQEAAALAERLDRAAERFEQARAHRLRLVEEAEAAATAVDAATAAAATARAAFEQVAVAAYKHPDAALAAGASVLASSGSAEVAHRAALMDRIVIGEAGHARRLAQQAQRAQHARQQHRTIQAGVASAQRDAEKAATALRQATDAAGDRAAALAAELQTARSDARERIRAERQAQRRRERAAQAGGRGRTVLPSKAALADMACPIGQPHGFTDSWHFPRPGGRVHLGVDLFADAGTPIRAVADGTVRRVWHNDLGGLAVDLLGDDGDRWYYAHLAAAHVASGQRVAAGEHIADNGNSGNARSTPAHLHWQYHPGDGDAVNPFPLASILCR